MLRRYKNASTTELVLTSQQRHQFQIYSESTDSRIKKKLAENNTKPHEPLKWKKAKTRSN